MPVSQFLKFIRRGVGIVALSAGLWMGGLVYGQATTIQTHNGHMAQVQIHGNHFEFDLKRGTFTLKNQAGEQLAQCSELWQLQFQDGTHFSASECLAQQGKLVWSVANDQQSLTLEFAGDGHVLQIDVIVRDDALELHSHIKQCRKAITRIDIPAQITFKRDTINRVVFPQHGLRTFGIAFTKQYYEPRQAHALSFTPQVTGDQGWSELFGTPLKVRGNNATRMPVKVTNLGRRWLDAQAIHEIQDMKWNVNRPSVPGQLPMVLLDSDAGPALAASDLGGKGLFLRLGTRTGGMSRDAEAPIQIKMIISTLEGWAREHPQAFRGRNIALAALEHGPGIGSWTAATVKEWEKALQDSKLVKTFGSTFKALKTPQQIEQALDDEHIALILNPYGEYLPFGQAQTVIQSVRKISNFVKQGGVWIETGGYAFYSVLQSRRFNTFARGYPPSVADFCHVDTTQGKFAIFGVQPLPKEPWANRSNPDGLFHPAWFETGGCDQGGFYFHGWWRLVEPGASVKLPPIRIMPGVTDRDAITAYKQSLASSRTLADKVSVQTLSKLKQAVLIRLRAPTAADQTALLDTLPRDQLVHFTEYLHGGFDRQYPDHLPPREAWGDRLAMQQFYKRGHDLGHLMMPYMNTSWWCIQPKGPTFQRIGTAPLLRSLDGSLNLESYMERQGYTVSYWHPDAIAEHRRVRQQLSEQCHSDLLFQDQIGARGWLWDTNPASPSASASPAGLYALSQEDSFHVPLATEDGHDRLIDTMSMFCGVSWGMIPTGGVMAKRSNFARFSPGQWEYYPLLSYIAHDRVLFTPHNLAHFITDMQRLTWALGMGFSLNYPWDSASATSPYQRAWLDWLCGVQQHVVSTYAGAPLLDFSYPFSSTPGQKTDVFLARYPQVRVLANTHSEALTLRTSDLLGMTLDQDWTIAGNGFLATGPKVYAGVTLDNHGKQAGFALSRNEQGWHGVLHGIPDAIFDLPMTLGKLVTCRDSATGENAALQINGRSLQLPAVSQIVKTKIPDTYANKAASQWHGRSRTIVVCNFPSALRSRVKAIPQDYYKALKASEKIRHAGFTVQWCDDPTELVTSLQREAKNRPFAVINPYGEFFYGPLGADPKKILSIIGDYIADGGIWWETGGYPFYVFASPTEQRGQWQRNVIGASGAAALGIKCDDHGMHDQHRALHVTSAGMDWFDAQTLHTLQNNPSGLQRPFTSGCGQLVLVSGDDPSDGFVQGVRGQGWGWLWHLGGLWPNPDVAVPAVTGVLEYLVTKPWPQPQLKEVARTWQVDFATP